MPRPARIVFNDPLRLAFGGGPRISGQKKTLPAEFFESTDPDPGGYNNPGEELKGGPFVPSEYCISVDLRVSKHLHHRGIGRSRPVTYTSPQPETSQILLVLELSPC